MSENINLNDNFGSSVSGVERVSKKKGGKIALISGIAAVAVIGGGVAAYNFSDFVKNQVNLHIMKPENYYSWVVEANSKNLASSAKEKYAKAADRAENGQNTAISLKYVISDEARDIALTEILGDDYRNTSSGEEKNLVEIFDSLNDISIGGTASVKDNALSGTIFAALNGENLINGDIALDYNNYDFFLRVSELTEQWLCVAMGDSIDVNSLSHLNGNVYDYLTPEQLEDIIVRYTNVWNESVSDIEIEKKEVVDICDISVEYTVISAELGQEDIIELAANYINELKGDDIIKNIAVNELELCTEEEYNSELDDILNEISSEDITDNGEKVTLDTYVDPNGDIRGVKLYDDDDALFFAVGKDGENVRAEFYFSESNTKIMTAELYADENGGKYNGSLDIMVDDEEVSVEFVNYEVVNEENGYFNAGVTFVIPDIDPVYIDFSSDGSSQDIAYNINIDGTDYGTVILSMSVNDGSSPEIPARDGAFIISDDMDSDPELADYIPEENMKSFINNVLVKTGFTEEIAAEGAEYIAMALYGTYDYYNYYSDYYDDFEYDWDDYEYDWNDYDDFGGYDDDIYFTFDDDLVIDDENTQDVWIPEEEGMFSVGDAEEIMSYIE